ncbi:uncharacterized protein EI90DRAFT_3021384 [Cantharellus anzutake]|uniref:uncharacterized protein n=1 Tax=Cantharellus anzutake TaxID=1750568 RepID=UPI001908784E|nr:uncharacterized protein EI90DRAFT_3021384 [Cantharellus anzutake]KAF8317243.1 hypothetical protein EI90DRAFT_3021384 [Cantharellus anzutake]
MANIAAHAIGVEPNKVGIKLGAGGTALVIGLHTRLSFNLPFALLNEIDAQAFVYAAAFKSPSNAYVTRSRGLRVLLSIGTVSSIFCVMERINPPTKIGAEISLIEGTHAQMHKSKSRTVRAESSHAHHPFFGNSLHRRTSLERRINTVWLSVNSPRSSGRTLPLGVKILDERVVTVQGNIKPPNLLIDPQTLQATIIDFGGVSALPHSFVSFTLAHCRVFGVRPITLW